MYSIIDPCCDDNAAPRPTGYNHINDRVVNNDGLASGLEKLNGFDKLTSGIFFVFGVSFQRLAFVAHYVNLG